MRRPSHLTRALRSLTALVTVWCLGCNAFDPLIAGLLSTPGGPMMVCAADATVPPAGVRVTPGQVLSIGVAPTDRDAGDGVTCDCGSCHAPPAAPLALVPAPASLLLQPSAEPGTPPSVERTPLVPPPQRGA